jgi:hypothetical protein
MKKHALLIALVSAVALSAIAGVVAYATIPGSRGGADSATGKEGVRVMSRAEPAGLCPAPCLINTPPPSVPPDGYNNTFGTALSLGTLSCGASRQQQGTTAPTATDDWFTVYLQNCPILVRLTADPGIRFDVVGAYGSALASGLTAGQVFSPSPFWIRVYGGGGVIGSWSLSLSAVSNP